MRKSQVSCLFQLHILICLATIAAVSWTILYNRSIPSSAQLHRKWFQTISFLNELYNKWEMLLLDKIFCIFLNECITIIIFRCVSSTARKVDVEKRLFSVNMGTNELQSQIGLQNSLQSLLLNWCNNTLPDRLGQWPETHSTRWLQRQEQWQTRCCKSKFTVHQYKHSGSGSHFTRETSQ